MTALDSTPSGPRFEDSADFARVQDVEDPLRYRRDLFHIPLAPRGEESAYFAGNSLGLQPRSVRKALEQELDDWARFGVEGHHSARRPWYPYHELLTKSLARIAGAQESEVVAMNTLTVNLHLMMVSFYRPTRERFKIVIEAGAFPSDRYAVTSQARFHARAAGFDAEAAVVELAPREGEAVLRPSDVQEFLEREGGTVALVLLGQVNFFTGQRFDLKSVAEAARKKGACVGFDLAHGIGNVEVDLHDSGADFAVWCSYKYLNGGPGALGGAFVHERHARTFDLPRFAGWWGHDKTARFGLARDFNPMEGAEGWQLSNPPILSLSALRAALEVFDGTSMSDLRRKSERLTGYLEFLAAQIPGDAFEQLTPRRPSERGCQLSFRIKKNAKAVATKMREEGIICDLREPDVIRLAPVPLYNTYEDVYRAAQALKVGILYAK